MHKYSLQRFLFLVSVSIVLSVLFQASSFSQETQINAEVSSTLSVDGVALPSSPPSPASIESAGRKASEEYVRWAWEASGQGDLKKLDQLTEECLSIYVLEADRLQSQLTAFPSRGQEKDYQILNDIGTILFVKAEALMNYGKTDQAIELFKKIIEEYKWAQAWDPRGWYWSVAEKSQNSIDVMTGNVREEEPLTTAGLKTLPHLHFKGKESIIDYKKYGQFYDVGSASYRYETNNPTGLSDAVGEGIYPNTGSVLRDPAFKKCEQEGRLEGSHWDFVHSDDLEAAFFKWVTAKEPWGIKLFYIGMIFEKAGMYYEAIKAYHAIVIHFPKAIGWTYWQTPWYPAQAAIAKIKHIIRTHPELNLQSMWMKMEVTNGFDNDISNDVVITYPGIIKKKIFWDQLKDRFNLQPKSAELKGIKRKLGEGKVQLVQYYNDHWQLIVEGKPYIIKGVTYAPTKIGQSPDKGTLTSWMYEDTNKNGLADGPFDSWVDKNRNNKQDSDEPTVGDFYLIRQLGANTIREYNQPFKPNKELLRKMYNEYGIRVIMGDFLGKYTLGSGATWFEGTDYENPEHQKNMMESVRRMVLEHKDEPYILFWLLGNENNYGIASNADKKPEAYFKFANEAAQMIKSIDPNHPVALCNGDTLYLDIFAKVAPDIDIFAANVYRGDYGFGSFWEQVFDATGKAAFISEYGCPAYAKHLTLEEGELAQENYHRGNWLDIETNLAGSIEGTGNALGGIAFEWTDEWWKNYEPFYHDKKSDAIGPFPGGYYYEEWFGLTGQGNGTKSPFLRYLRKSYFAYQEMWNKK